MKRLLLISVFIWTMGQNVYAYDFSTVVPSGQTLYFNFDEGGLAITCPGPSSSPWGGYSQPTGDLIIPASIVYNGVTWNITKIDQYAFFQCTGLTSVVIGDNVTKLSYRSFWGCSGISQLSMGQNVSHIGNESFKYCSGLSLLEIPSSVTYIDRNAFAYCVGLSSITFYGRPYYYGYGYNLEDRSFYCVSSNCIINMPCGADSTYLLGLAQFNTINEYIISPYYSLTAQSSNTSYGNVSLACDGTITATANHGYFFDHWSDNNTNNPRIITSLESDSTIIAFFDIKTYYVNSVSENNIMGYVVGSDSVLYLDTVTLVPIANYGYQFSHWNDGNTDNPRKVIVSRDSIFTAYFDSSLFVLQTLSNNEQMGYARISSSDYLASAVGNFKYLSTQTIYATSTDGNQFMQWSDGVLSNPRSVAIYGDTSFTAVFAPKYVLTVQSANDSMGTVTGGGLFNNQAQTVITAQANYGYHFTSWNDGVTTSTRTITVTSDTSFTANFARNQYSITATSANQSWGGVTGSTNALYGDSVTLTATAIGQHHFSYWSDGTNQYTDNPLHVRVTKNDYYTAFFEMNQYQVSVFTDGGGNGYVGLESTNNTGNYDYMTQVTIRAVPYSGNRFAGWSDGIVYNPRALTITKDTSFTALFAADIYTITVNSDNDVMGSVTGGGIYQADSIAEIAAVPNHGYKFDHWQDNVTINPRNVTVITNQTYTAYFVTYDTLRIHDTSYVDVFVHDTTVVVDSVWVYDTTIVTYTDTVINTVFDTITTTVFDTIVNTIYDTTVVYSTDTLWLTLHDTIYLPQYIHDTIYLHDTIYVGVDEAETINVKIYTSNGQIVVDGSDGNQVWLYDINGRLIATRKDNHSPLRFDIPSSGAYLVKIGNYHSRKVVVIK